MGMTKRAAVEEEEESDELGGLNDPCGLERLLVMYE
jgi:hypothetical protein